MQNNKLVKDSFMTFANNVVQFVFTILASIIVARILGPYSKGIYALIVLLPSLLSVFFNTGINSTVIFLKGRRGYSDGQLINASIFPIIILSAAALLTGLIAVIFGKPFFHDVPRHYLILATFVIPFNLMSIMLMSLLYSRENFTLINTVQFLLRAADIILVAMVIFNRSVLYLILVDISTSIAGLVIAYFIIVKRGKISIKPVWETEVVRDMVSFAWKVHLSNVITFLHYKADLFLISFFMNPFFVGIYSLAVNISEKIWMVSSSIGSVVYPKMTNVETQERTRLTNKTVRVVFFISVLTVLSLFMTVQFLIPFLYGESYRGSVLPVRILLVGILMISISRLMSNHLAASNKPQITLASKSATFLLNIILNIVFIPKYGVNGAAVATSISYSLNTIIVLIIYAKESGSTISDILFIKKSDLKNLRGMGKKNEI